VTGNYAMHRGRVENGLESHMRGQTNTIWCTVVAPGGEKWIARR